MDAQAQCASVDRLDTETEIGILRIGSVRKIKAFERLVEIGVGVEGLTGHELLTLPADGAASGRSVEPGQRVGKEIGVGEVSEILADINALAQQIG